MNYLYVFLGAGLGGSLRYYISNITYKYLPEYFPSATLIVNILGSIILGLLIFGLDEKELLHPNLKILFGIGFCGALTTFSTFSFETFNLLRSTQFALAFTNIFANVLLTILGIYLGYIISR